MGLTRVLYFLSFLASFSIAQNLGNPALLSSYPSCAQICATQNLPASGCSPTDLVCQCSAPYRSTTAACEKVTCSSSDYDKTQTLAAQLCAPVFSNGSVDATTVSAAIASATAEAVAATAGKDPTNMLNFPPCGQACMKQFLPANVSGCGSLSNRQCVCSSPALYTSLDPCERRTCSLQDRTIINDLADVLCAPVGGIVNASLVANQTIATQTAPAPAPATFTGAAQALVSKGMSVIWVAILMAGLLL